MSQFHHKLFLLLCSTIILFLSACASTTSDGDVNDPLESINRPIYDFNEDVDRLILKPVATGYQKLPSPIKTGTHNFFSNLDDVVVITNDLLQIKVDSFTSDTLRLSVNSVFGLFGLIDMGTPMGLPKNHESFADTLGYWGIGSGPYIVLPVFGPSSLRDAPSLLVDILVHPLYQVSPASTGWGLASIRAIDTRSELLKTTDIRDQLALDPYIFTRESYYQWRQNRVYDGEPPRIIIEDFEQ